jgi:hypothetical protein
VVLAILAVVAAALVIGAFVVYRLTRSNDAVESFRRQIDALSPEARRSVVDQVNRLDEGAAETPAAPPPVPPDPDELDAETAKTVDPPDDVRGT